MSLHPGECGVCRLHGEFDEFCDTCAELHGRGARRIDSIENGFDEYGIPYSRVVERGAGLSQYPPVRSVKLEEALARARECETIAPAQWRESDPEHIKFYRPFTGRVAWGRFIDTQRVSPTPVQASVVAEICRRIVAREATISSEITARNGTGDETNRHFLRAVESLRCAEESLQLAAESLEEQK